MSSTARSSPSSAVSPDSAHTAPNPPIPKSFSCVLCAQRKVKCDKRPSGCANCTKACVPCIYKAPPPPRRRKKGTRDVDIHARLRIYEHALRELGVDPAQLESRSEAHADVDAEVLDHNIPAGPPEKLITLQDPGVLISGDGKSRYLENGLWTSLKGELRESKDLLDETSDEEDVDDGYTPSPKPFPLDGGNLLFGTLRSTARLRSLHPQPVQIFKLWQTYLDNVNPLVKVFHTPTVQQILLEASGNLDDIPKNVEALLFSIYCVALASLGDMECNTIMGEPKSVVEQRFRTGVQHALINANFLKTSDMMILQAFVLFLISLQNYDARVIWIFVGIAGRIGQRLGLHRDGEILGLPPFEIEMRRRLWWQILFLEGFAEKLAGTGGNLFMGDTKQPSNVNDSDLFQGMKEMPKEHEGVTEMMFFKMRAHVGDLLKRTTNPKNNFDGAFSKLTDNEVALAVKDKAIDDLNTLFQTKYLRYCDRSIPWHFMCIYLSKGIICMLRFMAHHTEQQGRPSTKPSQSKSDMLFDMSLQVIAMQNLGYTTKEMHGFMWHVNLHFQWKALIYVIAQLRYRTDPPVADEAWRQVGMVYEFHPDLAKEKYKTSLPIAIGSLTLKSWDAFLAVRGAPEGGEPYFIRLLRAQKNKNKQSKNASEERDQDPSVTNMPTDPHFGTHLSFPTEMAGPSDPLQSFQFSSDFAASLSTQPIMPELPPLDPDSMNWSAWDDLVVDFQINDRGFATEFSSPWSS